MKNRHTGIIQTGLTITVTVPCIMPEHIYRLLLFSDKIPLTICSRKC